MAFLGNVLGFGAAAGGRALLGSMGGKDSTQGTSASDLYAQLTREQWANYVNTFVPIENALIKYATDTTLPGQEMAKASADVNAAYTQQAGATARRLRGLGVTLSPEEQAAQQKQYGLSKSLADVQSQNVAGDLTRQRQQSILGNPAPT
jgi:hypothetical protein